MNSPTKSLSKDHLTEKRFKPYCKASAYIKTINNQYNAQLPNLHADSAYLSSKNFQHQKPKNYNFKVSILPRSQVSEELEKKAEMVQKFQNLSELKSSKKKVLTRSITPMLKKNKFVQEIRSPSNLVKLIMQAKTQKETKCRDCKKKACECIDKTQDAFLKQILIGKEYFNKEKTKAKGNCSGRILPFMKKDEEFFVSDHIGAFNIFDDGSCAIIHTKRKKNYPRKNKNQYLKKVKIEKWEEFLDSAFSVSPVSYSERPKTKDSYRHKS